METSVAIVGAGPAGLIAAEFLSARGVAVTVYDRMPSAGRKFLMAGRGGLNLTHSEPSARFAMRYGDASEHLRPALDAFPPSALIAWANGLGVETFTGTSGRVFPKAMKASPLLRAWLGRLDRQGVRFALRHTWRGWRDDGSLLFEAPVGAVTVKPDYVLLALGGGSWPRLGSVGDWIPLLLAKGVAVAPLASANCGFDVGWSETLRDRFAGQPLKNVTIRVGEATSRGDVVVTWYGLEGGAIYPLSAALRDEISATGRAAIAIDLRPDTGVEKLAARLAGPGKDSLSNRLRKAGLSPLEVHLLREAGDVPREAAALAARIKALALTLTGVQPLARAISTAGGVTWDAVDDRLMLKAMPGVFVAGEMLDWEAPTGGYLLQACFATGAFAARAILARIGA